MGSSIWLIVFSYLTEVFYSSSSLNIIKFIALNKNYHTVTISGQFEMNERYKIQLLAELKKEEIKKTSVKIADDQQTNFSQLELKKLELISQAVDDYSLAIQIYFFLRDRAKYIETKTETLKFSRKFSPKFIAETIQKNSRSEFLIPDNSLTRFLIKGGLMLVTLPFLCAIAFGLIVFSILATTKKIKSFIFRAV